MHNSWGLNYFAKYFLVKADEVNFVELLSLSNLLPKHTVHRKSEIPNVYEGNMFPKTEFVITKGPSVKVAK